MPTPDLLHAALGGLARRATPIAVAWHVILAAALLVLLSGWRPSQRLAGLLLTVPLASVAVVAWWGGTPFNALVFGIAFVALALGSLALPPEPVEKASPGVTLWALVLVGFASMYPHFFVGASPLAVFYASPLGVLPCPTLACVIGLTILAQGLSSRAWSTTLALLGLSYGVFGTFVLRVSIDTFLTIGALLLLGVVWSGASVATQKVRHS
jgi:hypothetical protein